MDRWLLRLPDETLSIEGDIREYPAFRGMNKGDAAMLYRGVLYWAHKVKATQNDRIACNTACRRATEPFCVCSCGGKNHGIENRGLAEGAEPLDVIWDGR